MMSVSLSARVSRAKRILIWGLVALLMTGSALRAEVRAIADAQELLAALDDDLSGVTLVLAEGAYPAFRLQGERAPAGIRSADAARPARIAGLHAQGIGPLRAEDLVFDYQFDSDDPLWVRPFVFSDCSGLEVVGNRFEGDYAQGLGFPHDGRGYGMGFSLSNCSDVLFEDNFMRDFYKAATIRESRDLVLRGNEITAMRMDGLTFAQVTDVLVEDNYIHNFDRVDVPEDHADMIQIWTNRTEEASRNVVIRDNIFNSGAGLFTQTIFMGNELVAWGQAGEEMFYQNFTIENNLILNAHLNAITIGQASGLTIRGNTLIQNIASVRPGENPRTPLYTPRINVAGDSRGVLIEDNITHRIHGYEDQPDWVVANNLFLDNGSRPMPGAVSYRSVFVNGGMQAPPELLSTWQLLPGGRGDRPGLGASVLQLQ